MCIGFLLDYRLNGKVLNIERTVHVHVYEPMCLCVCVFVCTQVTDNIVRTQNSVPNFVPEII